MITGLNVSSNVKQCWFADDASGAGFLEDIKRWWEHLNEAGPNLGYFPNAKKCWLIIKPGKEESAHAIFDGTASISLRRGKSIWAQPWVLWLSWKNTSKAR